MFEDVNRLIEFSVQIGVIVGLVGGLAAWLKRSVNMGMVTKEEHEAAIIKIKIQYEKYVAEKISAHKEQTTKDDDADKKWLNTLQNKVEQNGKSIYKIAGKVGVDL